VKKTLLFLAFFLHGIFLKANNTVDSLLHVLNTSSDQKKIEVLLEIANNYGSNNFDSALFYANQAIEWATKLAQPLQIATGLKTKGNILFRKGELDKALLLYNQSLEINIKYHNELETAKIHNNLGLLYMQWGEMQKALQNLEAALAIYNNANEELLTCGPLINMGSVNFRSGNYSAAEKEFKDALSIGEKYSDLEMISTATKSLGAVYNEWGKYVEALEYYNRSIETFKALNDKYREAIAYYNIGDVYEELGDYSTAIEYVLISLSLKKEIDAKFKIPVSLNKLGHIYRQWKKYELALNYYADALSLAKDNKDKLEIANALTGMAQVYAETDIYVKALDFFNEALFLYIEIEGKKEIAQLNNEIGSIYSEKLKDFSKAGEYFNKAEHIYKQIESNSGLATLYSSKGNYYFMQESYIQAIDYLQKSIQLASINSYKMLDNYMMLAQCYTKLKKYDEAIEAYKISLLYKDTTVFDKTKLQLAQFEVQYEIQKKNQEINDLMRQSELNMLLLNKKKDMQILLITFIILLAVIIVLVLFFYKKLKTVNENLILKQNEFETQKKHLEDTNKQLIEANNQAERMSKFKNQFLANISHEIRTPLNAITGYSNLLAKNLTIESNTYYINQVLQASDNMTVIISDLLDFSKIEAGKMMLESIKFAPVKIITQTISTLKFRAEEKNIQLEIHIDPFIPKAIIGDPYRLSQILINLINNAIKFSNDGQVVTIEAKCENTDEDCSLEFVITDKGVGIPELKLATIFESFTQINSDTSRMSEGTGLGLSIVKRLIELQNGTITVKSKVKQGSTFSFTIKYKIAESDSNEITKNTTKDKTAPLSGTYNILLVEDNLINQELAKDTISSWKEPYIVDVAENGKEAIMALQKKTYHVVLMDIQMPVMDGHEATQYIRSSLPAPKCNVPIIGMTAHALSSEKELALKNGMNEYIIKPFNPDELKQKITYFVTLKD